MAVLQSAFLRRPCSAASRSQELSAQELAQATTGPEQLAVHISVLEVTLLLHGLAEVEACAAIIDLARDDFIKLSLCLLPSGIQEHSCHGS